MNFSNKTNPYRNNQTKCYRPLQQLYKKVYGINSSDINFACISRPSERYKTTNMTYGSFHYNNWAFIQKNRSVNCKQQKMNLKNPSENQPKDSHSDVRYDSAQNLLTFH